MDAALFEDAVNLLRSNQRPRGIVHRDVSYNGFQMIQTSAHGILPALSAWNNRLNLFKIFIANDRFDFIVSIFPGDDDDCVYGAGTLKCADRVRDHRFAGNRRKQFIETHAAAVTGRDNDGV